MNDIQELTIKELLSSNDYRIPIYQRNYAWGLGETTQLIQDIADYAKDSPTNNYYIGNLIVFPRHKDNSFLLIIEKNQTSRYLHCTTILKLLIMELLMLILWLCITKRGV